MQRLGASQVVEVEAFQDVEGFTDRRAPARWRTHAVNAQAAIGGGHRLAKDDTVIGDVVSAHHPRSNIARDAWHQWRVLDGVDDVLSNRSFIEDLGTLLCDQTVGVRQIRVAEQRAYGGGGAVRRWG